MKSRWKRGRKKEGQGVSPFQRNWSERTTLKRLSCELGRLKKPRERCRKSISHRGNCRGKGPGWTEQDTLKRVPSKKSLGPQQVRHRIIIRPSMVPPKELKSRVQTKIVHACSKQHYSLTRRGTTQMSIKG